MLAMEQPNSSLKLIYTDPMVLAYFVEAHKYPSMFSFNWFFSSTILQYKKLKMSKFIFLENFVMKIKESKVLYYSQGLFSLS